MSILSDPSLSDVKSLIQRYQELPAYFSSGGVGRAENMEFDVGYVNTRPIRAQELLKVASYISNTSTQHIGCCK